MSAITSSPTYAQNLRRGDIVSVQDEPLEITEVETRADGLIALHWGQCLSDVVRVHPLLGFTVIGHLDLLPLDCGGFR
jgi:hypothetical protein